MPGSWVNALCCCAGFTVKGCGPAVACCRLRINKIVTAVNAAAPGSYVEADVSIE
jgi:hypothetical protein